MTLLPVRNLDYVVLLCRDLAPMRRYYHDVLGFPVYRDWPGWLELQVGSSLLTLRLRGRAYDGPAPDGAAGVQLAFRVPPDDLDAWHARLAAQGVEVLEGVADKGHGHRTVFFRDPEGNVVELYADVPARPEPPVAPPAAPAAAAGERQKMLAGELYDPLDPELVRLRARARDLCWDLNATRESQQDERRRLLRELLGAGGEDVWLQPPFFCDYGTNIRFGQHCFLNFNCVFLDVCPITIGSHVFFGPAVQIYTATHPLDADLRRTQEFGKPVVIGSDVWVGGGAILCPGVRVGSRSVIGAGSVVTRDVPDGVLAVGNPCRVVRALTDRE